MSKLAKILYNDQVSKDFYLMRVESVNSAKAGQFYMLRAWDKYPVLSRPISVFDADGDSVTFLYKVVGEGTELFSRLEKGGDITLLGPLGNGFTDVSGTVALVGGGVGIAPLYLAAKTFTANKSVTNVGMYLGFSESAILTDRFESVADNVVTDVGGFITDKIDVNAYDHILTCGPEAMMRALYEKCKSENVAEKLWVSMENRMACGIGACLVCSCKTKDGNKKACKDGPVFKGEAVFGI